MKDDLPDPVRLLIADRRPIAALGLGSALADAMELVVVACCHDVEAASIVLARTSTIDVVIVDVEMFDGDALRIVDFVRRRNEDVAILLLTTGVDAPLLAALANDRVSCVSAYSAAQQIGSALRALLNGQTMLPPQVQRALTDMLRQDQLPPEPMLTAREEQVLELAATGLTISQIALRLHISHSTAKTHLLRVYGKLNAPNRSAAVATAVARGMLRVSASAG